MRISDWSSDVCSSDLIYPWRRLHPNLPARSQPIGRLVQDRYSECGRPDPARRRAHELLHHRPDTGQSAVRRGDPGSDHRSEEHTSELQSLMRISYAVFCLKKKKINTKLII